MLRRLSTQTSEAGTALFLGSSIGVLSAPVEVIPRRGARKETRLESAATCAAGAAAAAEKNREMEAPGATVMRFRRPGPLPLKAPDMEGTQAVRTFSVPARTQRQPQGQLC